MRIPAVALGLLLATACGSDGAPLGDAPDADTGDAGGQVCEPFSSRMCSDNSVFWQDSCGALGELIEECGAELQCSSAFTSCCAPARTSGQMPALPWPVAVGWVFDPGSELLATIVVHDDPGESLEMSLDVEVRIGGDLYYFALENHLPASGVPASKKGIRFYNVRSGDTDAVRTTTGVISGNSTERRIELPYFWQAGHTYSFRLTRAESQAYEGATADWFDLTVSEDDGAPTAIGGVLVPRTSEAEPVQIPADIRTHYKIVNYEWGSSPAMLDGELADYSLLGAAMDATIDLRVDGDKAVSRTTHYGVDADELTWSNVDAGLDGDLVRMAFGGGIATCNQERTL